MSLISATACFFIVIPAAIIGVLAKFVDWSKIPGYDKPFDMTESNSVLPLVLRYLTPGWVTFFGLGAVSASVMSSADSVILGSGSMFTRNIYHQSFRPKVWIFCTLSLTRMSRFCKRGRSGLRAGGTKKLMSKILPWDSWYLQLNKED